MIGALLPNEPQGKTEGAQALAAWSSHFPTWEMAERGREREELQLVLPFSFQSFRKAGISKEKIRKYSSSNNIKNYSKELPRLTQLFYE